MVLCSAAGTLLAVCAIAAAQGYEPEIDRSSDLLATIRFLDEPVGIFTSIGDPNKHCLTARRETFEPLNRNATYIWTYPRANASFGNRTRCSEVMIQMTKWGYFPFRYCGEGQPFVVAQGLYSDRRTCFIGRYPPGDECLLFVNYPFKDSFPAECETQFDRLCGESKYALYDGRNCD
ncbi:uncharacterized protein LOC144148751 [Haemaphysalis longicornis]